MSVYSGEPWVRRLWCRRAMEPTGRTPIQPCSLWESGKGFQRKQPLIKSKVKVEVSSAKRHWEEPSLHDQSGGDQSGEKPQCWVIQMAGRLGLKTEGCRGEEWGEGFRSSLRARSLSQAANLLSLSCRSLSPRIPDQPSSGLLDQIGGWDSLIQRHVQPYWNLKQACVLCVHPLECIF